VIDRCAGRGANDKAISEGGEEKKAAIQASGLQDVAVSRHGETQSQSHRVPFFCLCSEIGAVRGCRRPDPNSGEW